MLLLPVGKVQLCMHDNKKSFGKLKLFRHTIYSGNWKNEIVCAQS